MTTAADGGAGPLRSALLAAAVLGCVVGLVALLTVLGGDRTTSPGVMSDALGPESGEAVDAYLARARASIEEPGLAERWALVAFDVAEDPARAADDVAGVERVSRVYGQVPRPGVAMPVVWRDLPEPVGTDRVGLLRDGVVAAARASRLAAPGGRDGELTRLTEDRLVRGDPGVVALLVRSEPASLRTVAGLPGVRVVEAAPEGAVAGRFAVRPLLPQQRVVADPLDDSSPVPRT